MAAPTSRIPKLLMNRAHQAKCRAVVKIWTMTGILVFNYALRNFFVASNCPIDQTPGIMIVQ